ncbi:MAG: hypothetical protein ACLRQX_03510 [Turicibacter sanguinis]
MKMTRVSVARWYYQSEFYLEVMKEIEELIENNQLGFVINFLQEIGPYLEVVMKRHFI